MIFDSLPHFNDYLPMHSLFGIVSEFLQSNDVSRLPLGKLSLPGDITFIKSDYSTQDIQSKFIECHRHYIDIHIVDEGSETIGFCHRDDCTILERYDEKKDFEKLSGVCNFFILRKGYFGIFLPQDAHMPGLNVENRIQNVKKIVFKVPV
jgi:YhcH/YjgK/YiaL family protein